MNNQFNNDFNNQYNNQYNDPYNNQFNNFGQQSFNHQKVPYITKNDNRGGGFFSFLLAVILLIACGALLLHFLGYVDLSGYLPILDKFAEVDKGSSSSDDGNKTENESNNTLETPKEENSKEEQEEKKDDEKEDENLSESEKAAKSMCSLVDDKGSYVKDENNLCRENLCIVLTNTAGYIYDCNEKKSTKAELDELKVETSLEYACAKIDTNGSYSSTELGLSCSNFICNLNYQNVNYTRVCNIEE